MNVKMTRRHFIGTAAVAGAGMNLHFSSVANAAECGSTVSATAKPVLLGGKPVRTKGFQSWPVVSEHDETSIQEVVHSGRWYRGKSVEEFEEAYAKLNDAKYCLATSSGTSALYASLGGLGVGPGDEVIVPPYTFVATVNVVLLNYAMPVFVDSDRETFLMDPKKLESAITPRTAAIIPVHIGGAAADMDNILAIAKKHNVPVIEDACQAHLGQWRERNLGTLGTTGCFSFQISKNLGSGEGGAVLTNDESMANKCFAFHNNCRKRKTASYNFTYEGGRATNIRMTEFQGALLLSQMRGLEQRAKTRHENGKYLTGMLREIPGIVPARMYDGCTRNAYHLYMFRYQPEKFSNLPRQKFMKALSAEGIPCSGGYGPLNKASFIKNALNARPYVKVYGKDTIAKWDDDNRCPENDKLCEEAVWFTQNMLLGPRSDMDEIAEAVRKIKKHAEILVKS
ncbi:MAG: DegT/DnrJ/EryC1/StrS family aminotransferase [Kiritimatiellae bacterium]|nr:DegT/DnrJ/EryC1/StrS family aminotransferase [Kiritimatiellia bacterium]MDD5521204.1 DegT/DnrJ/EryC1/StrS family aminotransferase [Kiritimatiellia bacterium]